MERVPVTAYGIILTLAHLVLARFFGVRRDTAFLAFALAPPNPRARSAVLSHSNHSVTLGLVLHSTMLLKDSICFEYDTLHLSRSHWHDEYGAITFQSQDSIDLYFGIRLAHTSFNSFGCMFYIREGYRTLGTLERDDGLRGRL